MPVNFPPQADSSPFLVCFGDSLTAGYALFARLVWNAVFADRFGACPA